VAAAPFNSGLLAQAHPGEDARFNYEPVPAPLLRRARELARACERFGVALPQAALQFPLRHEAVVSVVAGMATADEVRGNAAWMRGPVPESLWPALD
jgi:D-threo-aldose 1-dehydrogenase